MVSRVDAAKFWRVLLLTCRNPDTDFRRPLAEELEALGHRVTYAFLKRRPTVIDMAAPDQERHFSLPAFLAYARREFSDVSPLLVFNSTNLAFPGTTRLLRALCGGLWCLDMHDDLLYGAAGMKRRYAEIAQRVLLSGADFTVHAAPTLQERFTRSRHLGNASSLPPVPRPDPDFSRILILSSLDWRIDYGLISAVARHNSDLGFDIYGQVSQGDPTVQARLDALLAEAPNVFYRGAYVNGELPGLLARYPVTFAPYDPQSPLTYFIDPLRYYHCLNSGMEVVSTGIPKARDFGNVLHVIDRAEEFGPLMERLRTDPSARRNAGSTAEIHNWRNRAARLMEIAVDERARRKERRA